MRFGGGVLALLMSAPAAWAQSAAPDSLPDGYIPFTCNLTDSGLVGTSEQLEGFTITMDVPHERFAHGLELDAVLAAVRDRQATGTVTYPDGHTTAIAYEMVRHRGPEEIYMKTTLGYFLWEYLSVVGNQVHLAINWWYCPPATPADLAAVEMAARLLASPAHWHQADDRACDDDEATGRWSLFCALKHASIETMGEYNHHNTAMQTVRFVINELVPNNDFAHTLKDFNNAAATSHADILHVLNLALQRIEARLAKPLPASKRERN